LRAERAGIALGLAAGVALAFWGALDCGFLAWDDDLYVTANPQVLAGLRGAGVGWAFTTFHAGNWHPLTWLSHMLDVTLFGVNPMGHHATSVVLHAGCAVLAFAALAELTGTTWRAAFAAALFALHPLRVESVVWVAERKDVLSAAFALGSLWAYARWARQKARGPWWASLALFAAALLAKPMPVTLPFLFLLLDAWPLGRLRAWRELGARAAEKWPFFALSAASCLVTLHAQSAGIAVRLPVTARAANAVVALAQYVLRAVDPRELAALYPYHPVQPRVVLAAGLFVAALALLAFSQRRTRPWLAVGASWFAGMLVPALGLVQVGVQASADRYTYLPFLGLALAASWSLAELAERVPAGRTVAGALAGLVLAACAVETRRQVPYWHDTVSLLGRAIEVTRANWYAHTELGVAYATQGDLAHARLYLEKSLEWNQDQPRARAYLGLVDVESGAVEHGITELQRALLLDPEIAGGRYALATALERAGRLGDAVAEYGLALADPRSAQAARARLERLGADARARGDDALAAGIESRLSGAGPPR